MSLECCPCPQLVSFAIRTLVLKTRTRSYKSIQKCSKRSQVASPVGKRPHFTRIEVASATSVQGVEHLLDELNSFIGIALCLGDVSCKHRKIEFLNGEALIIMWQYFNIWARLFFHPVRHFRILNHNGL